MKIVNYNYGYLFDCSIHGKITITTEELEKFKKYLNNPSVLRDCFWKRLYKEDLNRRIPRLKGKGYWINLRTTITSALVQKFGTPENKKKYRQANYVFEVI